MSDDRTAQRPWKVLRSETGPDLRLFAVRFDWVENPRNRKVFRAVVLEARDWVNVVAVTPEKKIITVSQYRFGIRRQSLEIPAGLVDPGEDSLHAAQRELAEETGYSAHQWKPLGWSFANPAFLDNRAHHFLALDAVRTQSPHPEDGEDLICRELTLEEIRQAIRSEDMRNAMTLLALSKAFDLRTDAA
jgi:ADP-ribose pyrophosphatase